VDVVNETLSELGASDKPMFFLFNKIDTYSYVEKESDDLSPSSRENMTLEEWEKSWMSKYQNVSIFISAKKSTNIVQFKRKLYDEVKKIHVTRFPFNDFLFPGFEEQE
jgi:GTP-binding protein HflX